jgi:hypothetical protein
VLVIQKFGSQWQAAFTAHDGKGIVGHGTSIEAAVIQALELRFGDAHAYVRRLGVPEWRGPRLSEGLSSWHEDYLTIANYGPRKWHAHFGSFHDDTPHWRARGQSLCGVLKKLFSLQR